MSLPIDIFTEPNHITRIAAIERRIRALERTSWSGRQRFSRELTTATLIEAGSYGLENHFPEIPVDVREDAWVSISASSNWWLYNSGPFIKTEIWGAIFETTDAGDPFYSGQQVFNTYQIGVLARDGTEQKPTWGLDLVSNPHNTHGDSAFLTVQQSLVYRPAITGEKVYTLDFKRTLGAATPSDFAILLDASLTVEIR